MSLEPHEHQSQSQNGRTVHRMRLGPRPGRPSRVQFVAVVRFDRGVHRLFRRFAQRAGRRGPVKYRGVTIGYVKRVMVHFNQAPTDSAMPVVMEIQTRLIEERLGPVAAKSVQSSLAGWLSENTRATLEAESLLTGVLYVNIETKANPAPPVRHQLTMVYLEIPHRTDQDPAHSGTVDGAGPRRSDRSAEPTPDAARHQGGRHQHQRNQRRSDQPPRVD